jgi:hypothetical protein
MPTGKDGREDLLDDVVLADDDLLQFFLHELPVLAELLQDVSQATRLGGQTRNPSLVGATLRARHPSGGNFSF